MIQLAIFTATCGHEWIGAMSGSFACPVCGLHDGDHHLTSSRELPVQVETWGGVWKELTKQETEVWKENRRKTSCSSIQNGK